MGVKQHRGKWQVDLHGRYVGVYDSEDDATMMFQSGRRLVALGRSLDTVVDELRGHVTSSAPLLSAYYTAWASTLTLPADTINRYGINFRRLPASLRSMRIDAIGTDDVRAAVKTMVDAGLAPKSVIESVNVMRSVLHAAVDARIIERNPASKVRNLPTNVRKTEPRVLEQSEYPRVVAAAPEWARTMVAVWPLIGLRAGEMVALRKSHVDFERHVVRVEEQRTVERVTKAPKAGSVGTVPLIPEAERLMRRQIESVPGPFVFVNTCGRQVSRSCLRDSIFQPISTKVGFLVRPHDMRHTAGAWLIASGATIADVQAFLRHKDASITSRVYTHELKERREAAMAGFQAFVSGDRTGTRSDD